MAEQEAFTASELRAMRTRLMAGGPKSAERRAKRAATPAKPTSSELWKKAWAKINAEQHGRRTE